MIEYRHPIIMIIVFTLLICGCIEPFQYEYRRGYDDGYNNNDDAKLQCVINDYNKCIDIYNLNHHYKPISYVEFRPVTYMDGRVLYQYGMIFDGIRYQEFVPLWELEGDYLRLTNTDKELYLYGFLKGTEKAYNKKQKADGKERAKAMEVNLSISMC